MQKQNQMTLLCVEMETTEVSMLYELLDWWYRNYGVIRKKETADCYLSAVKRIKNAVEDMPIDDFTELKAQAITIAIAKKGYARSTVDKSIVVLRSAFKRAYRNGLIDYLPFFDVEIPEYAGVKAVDSLSRADQLKVEAACKVLDYGYITEFLLQTGLRIQELCDLKWTDYVHFPAPYIKIRKSKTKNGIRKVPLTERANDIIKSQPKLSEHIFLSLKGHKMSRAILKDHNKKIRELTGIEDFHNHICRHTFAARALEDGVHVKALSQILGHASVAFTMQRYCQTDEQWLFEQIKILN